MSHTIFGGGGMFDEKFYDLSDKSYQGLVYMFVSLFFIYFFYGTFSTVQRSNLKKNQLYSMNNLSLSLFLYYIYSNKVTGFIFFRES